MAEIKDKRVSCSHPTNRKENGGSNKNPQINCILDTICVDQSTQTGPKIKMKHYTDHLWKPKYKNRHNQAEKEGDAETNNYHDADYSRRDNEYFERNGANKSSDVNTYKKIKLPLKYTEDHRPSLELSTIERPGVFTSFILDTGTQANVSRQNGHSKLA